MNLLWILAIAAVAPITSSAKLPKNWKTCKRSDPKINECTAEALQGALSDLTNGVPSLGVLPLDPLHLIRLELDQGENKGPVAINLTFSDIDLFGFKYAKVKSTKVDWNKGILKGSVDVVGAPVQLIGNYAVSGKILLLPITGQGKCNFTLVKSGIEMELKGSTIEKNGKKYFHCDKLDINLRQERVIMNLENLFNGDKTLGENMNKVLNENWQEVFEAFRSTIQGGLGEAYREISNRVFDRVPMDQIAPL